MQVAFSGKPKSPPQLARLPSGYAVLQVIDQKPAATPTFEEARQRIETEFRNQQATSLLDKKTQELSERAKALHDLKKAAKEEDAAYKTSDLVTQQSQVPDLGSMSQQAAVAFTLGKNQISGPIVTGRNGAVLQIVDQQEPSPEEFAKNKETARDSLLQRKRGESFQLYAQGLVQAMEKDRRIKYNKEEPQQQPGKLNPAGS
jgi:peptidyl-prolyl cis-trans isomerase D